jgi:predicted nuclease of predicted toxin-antitoxin system
VGTLASGLGHVAEGLAQAPRVYCDANLPIGLIRFMRERLRWDVFFVLEEEDLRRAPDVEHYRMAAQLRRTLLTLDHDYLDDARFPPEQGVGVLVLSAADEAQFERLLLKVDRMLFKSNGDGPGADGDADRRLPLLGRKLHVHIDWSGEIDPR